MSRNVGRAYGRVAIVNPAVERPWGHFVVLDESAATHKVNTIRVEPGHRLSLQSHQRRGEHWFVVAGEGLAWLDEGRVPLRPGRAVDVAMGVRHRVENTGSDPLVFVEVQHGTYFGEDDIVRYEDDYGR